MVHQTVSRWHVLTLQQLWEKIVPLINSPLFSFFSQNGYSSGQVQL